MKTRFWTALILLFIVPAVYFALTYSLKRRHRHAPFENSKGKKRYTFHFVYWLIGSLFASAFILLWPIYRHGGERGVWMTTVNCVHQALQIFTMGADRGFLEKCSTCGSYEECAVYSKLFPAYLTLLSAEYIYAPVLTFGFVVSFFKNLTASVRYHILTLFHNAYVFSELNENSLALAASIRGDEPGATIVYTDVFDNNDVDSYELADKAQALSAICFKKDILSPNFRWRPRRISFFVIGKDESENMRHAVRLINRYGSRRKTEMYVFSARIDSELLLNKTDCKAMKVRRVNVVQSLIYRNLYDNGYEKLFKPAKPMPNGNKKISALIVGMGRHGTEMVKALSWYCQMDGYDLEINACDKDELADERFKAQCPELMDDAHNHKSVKGEARYGITIHGGIDMESESFSRLVKGLGETTYVLVALGSDEANIRTAVYLRMLFERMQIKPVIQAIVYNSDEKQALEGVKNFKDQPYGIEFIGDTESSYSKSVIMNSELEKRAVKGHTKWGESEDSFWRYEYNYRSSCASAIHIKARVECGIQPEGITEQEVETQPELAERIGRIEHCRWNAYMRSNGYVYSGSQDKSSRNDLAKMHYDLVRYKTLSDDEKKNDLHVGTL